MSKVPVGIRSFGEIRDTGAYYVDKTRLVDYILSEYGTEAFLFTRPHGFGKSVNLSMLDSYLNLEYAGNRWFDGLEISRMRPDDPEKNAYPVIRLDMEGLDAGSLDSIMDGIRQRISMECNRHREILDSDRVDAFGKEIFGSLLEGSSDDTVLRRSLRLLSSIYEAHYGARTVILIDGYDGPANDSYGQPQQGPILSFMGALLSSGLKGNGSLRLGVMTGVMPFAKGRIPSGLNNLKVDDILSTDMDWAFGFTPEEVRRLCSDQGHSDKFDEAVEWYGGYRFGDADVCNPRSILMYADCGFEAGPYWTGGDAMVDGLLSDPDRETRDALEALADGGSVGSGIRHMTFADIGDGSEGMYAAMAMAGYLSAAGCDGGAMLSVPNREMRMFLEDKAASWTRVG